MYGALCQYVAKVTSLIINVVLDSKLNNNLNVFGGYFSIDISDITANVDTAFMNFETVSWLGILELNLLTISRYNSTENTIEVGFTKTDGTISSGRGIIGKLILGLNPTNINRNSACENLIELSVNEIGSFDRNENPLEIEEEYTAINLGTSCCQPSITINEETPFQNLYQSSGFITTNDFLPIGEDQQVEYNANRVTLNEGFRVKAGADFRVRSSGCN